MTRALISVSDKKGVIAFAEGLIENGIEIISTGGTKKVLDEAGIPTISIEEVTDFPEMMDGRVKTLHPKIHGGLLGRRDLASHMEAMAASQITPIDFVCVNLYPFKETIMKSGVTEEEACLLYTSDAADEEDSVDLGGRRLIKKKNKSN